MQNRPLRRPAREIDPRPAAGAGRPAPGRRFLDLVADKLLATEEVFRPHLDSDVPFIHRAGEYIAARGRQAGAPGAAAALAPASSATTASEEVTYAAVVEFIHTATLIHDDIIDHAGLRRGQPTLNHLWGNNLTVLLGDWIYTKAMQMALSHGQLEVVQRLCDATLKMTEGELLALPAPGRRRPLGRGVLRDHRPQDGAPLRRRLLDPQPDPAAAARRPARCSPATAARSASASSSSTTCSTSPPARASWASPCSPTCKEGKLTLPLLLLLPRVAPARAAADRDGCSRTAASSGSRRRRSWSWCAPRARSRRCASWPRSYAAEAKRELEFFPPGDARDALEFAPDFVLNRRS